jgi:hypothetical protein
MGKWVQTSDVEDGPWAVWEDAMPLQTAATKPHEKAGVYMEEAADMQVREAAATPRFYTIPRARLSRARIQNPSRLGALFRSGTDGCEMT